MVDSDDDAWRRRALCRRPPYSQAPWFGQRSGDFERCAAICQRCHVTEACVTFALTHDVTHGIWGGHAAADLRRARRDVDDVRRALDLLG